MTKGQHGSVEVNSNNAVIIPPDTEKMLTQAAG
jgi:hypothetical protein